jgi:hypothetical protein
MEIDELEADHAPEIVFEALNTMVNAVLPAPGALRPYTANACVSQACPLVPGLLEAPLMLKEASWLT